MKQATELINSIEMSSTEMIAPISALYKANKITGEEFFKPKFLKTENNEAKE